MQQVLHTAPTLCPPGSPENLSSLGILGCRGDFLARLNMIEIVYHAVKTSRNRSTSASASVADVDRPQKMDAGKPARMYRSTMDVFA